MTNREALARAYDILSPFADSQRWEFHNQLRHLEFLSAHVPKDKKILDAGCGIGILILALRLLGYRVQGTDKYVFQASHMFEVNDMERLKGVWKEQNIMIEEKDMAFEGLSETFDVVTSVAVIEHQPYPKQFLEHLSRSVKPGGYLYIATPNVCNLLNRFRVFFGKPPLGNVKDFFDRASLFHGHWREYTLSELRSMVSWAGLTPEVSACVQSEQPNFSLKKWRKWHRGIFRILARWIPGCGDTIFVFARKEKIESRIKVNQ